MLDKIVQRGEFRLHKTKSVETMEATNSMVIQKFIDPHLHPAQAGLITKTGEHPRRGMMGGSELLKLLQTICKAIGAKKTIEVGCFTGYSALSIALALPEDGKVVSLDICEEDAAIGKPFWKEARVDHKIDLRIGPALESLDKMLKAGEAGTYDLAFIDADKTNYPNYYEQCLTLIRPNGFLAIDNAAWGGSIHDVNDNSPDTMAIRRVNDMAATDPRVEANFLNISDGLVLCRKK